MTGKGTWLGLNDLVVKTMLFYSPCCLLRRDIRPIIRPLYFFIHQTVILLYFFVFMWCWSNIRKQCQVGNYTPQQKHPISSFSDPNLKIHIFSGEIKVVKRRIIYFCTLWHLIYWNSLTNARDLVISLLVDQDLKLTPTGFKLTAAANNGCVLSHGD